MGCEAYLKEVAKGLELPKPLRRQLLDGLRQELEEGTCISELEPPAVMAAQLMESVDSGIKARYRRRRRYAARITIAALIVLLAVVIGYFAHLERTQVVRAEEHITVGEPVPLEGD